jgi:hypothetical protein
MKKADEFAKHAKDCRALAKQMALGEQRDQLPKMAETWDVLASERERTLRKAGRASLSRNLGYSRVSCAA